jgi:hypothetical protein
MTMIAATVFQAQADKLLVEIQTNAQATALLSSVIMPLHIQFWQTNPQHQQLLALIDAS